MAGIISGLLGFIGCGKKSEKGYELSETYRSLRWKVLSADPAKIGLDPSWYDRVWGVLMETGHTESVATLAAIADGTVSLYFGNGGGIIGAGGHEGPRKACLDLISSAPEYIRYAKHTEVFPNPEKGHTRFYFMTPNGVLTADSVEEDLGNNREPLSPFFHKAHEVITQIRLIDEERRKTTAQMLHAATTGDINTLRAMIDSGSPVNTADNTGLTPLMAAAYAGMTNALELLLDSGAEIDAADSSGYTALMFACNEGRRECAQLLIDRGANIHRRDKELSTPIMFAAQHAHNEIVRLLLSKGADPEVKGAHGLSAIGFARQNRHSETERILMRRQL